MPIRTSITHNPITPKKEAEQKKYSTLKLRTPTHHIADVLTQQEIDNGNKQFREDMNTYEGPEAKRSKAHQRYR